MSLDNLTKVDKERIGRGDIQFFKETLKKELEEVKDNLILFPSSQLEELRGKAKVLIAVLKLLGN